MLVYSDYNFDRLKFVFNPACVLFAQNSILSLTKKAFAYEVPDDIMYKITPLSTLCAFGYVKPYTPPTPVSGKCLTFTNVGIQPATIAMYGPSDTEHLETYTNIMRSYNSGDTWLPWDAFRTTITLMPGQSVQIKADAVPYNWPDDEDWMPSHFDIHGLVNVSGSVMSMYKSDPNTLEFDDLPEDYDTYDLENLFQDCDGILTAPELPATKLVDYCYAYMFRNCVNLTKAPELPALNLASDCYDSMFDGCTSLTEAPALPAITLESYCYYAMFAGCSALTKAPDLPATELAYGCYERMFAQCENLSEARVAVEPVNTSEEMDGMFSFVNPTGTLHAPGDKRDWEAITGLPGTWSVVNP